jgi:hypothetical protein
MGMSPVTLRGIHSMAEDADLTALEWCLENYRERMAATNEFEARDRLRGTIMLLEGRISSLRGPTLASSPASSPPS